MISFRDTQIFYLQTVKKIASIFQFIEKFNYSKRSVLSKKPLSQTQYPFGSNKKRFGCICNHRLLRWRTFRSLDLHPIRISFHSEIYSYLITSSYFGD